MPPEAAVSKRKAIPKGKNILDVKDLKRDELAKHLRDADIDFDHDALKPRLQATFAMLKLGLITPGGAFDEVLLVKVTTWCCLSASKLAGLVSGRGLDEESNKWKRLEALIRDEYENPGAAEVKKEVQDVGDALDQMSIKKKAGPSGTSKNAKETTQHPEPIQMNLVLTLLYGDVTKNYENACAGCPIKSAATVTELIDTMFPYRTTQDVASDLSAAKKSPATQLVSWLSSECTAFAPATGDMKIPGFKDSVHQFVVVRQNEKIHAAFEDLMKKSSGMSWCGTAHPSVTSALF